MLPLSHVRAIWRHLAVLILQQFVGAGKQKVRRSADTILPTGLWNYTHSSSLVLISISNLHILISNCWNWFCFFWCRLFPQQNTFWRFFPLMKAPKQYHQKSRQCAASPHSSSADKARPRDHCLLACVIKTTSPTLPAAAPWTLSQLLKAAPQLMWFSSQLLPSHWLY